MKRRRCEGCGRYRIVYEVVPVQIAYHICTRVCRLCAEENGIWETAHKRHASGEFPCHKQCEVWDDEDLFYKTLIVELVEQSGLPFIGGLGYVAFSAKKWLFQTETQTEQFLELIRDLAVEG